MHEIATVGRFLSDSKMVWERQFSVEPERLWDAISTKDGLSHWFMPTKYETEVTGRFSFDGGWEGTVSEARPFHNIQFDADGDCGAYLRFEMEAGNSVYRFALIEKMPRVAALPRLMPRPRRKNAPPAGPRPSRTMVTISFQLGVAVRRRCLQLPASREPMTP